MPVPSLALLVGGISRGDGRLTYNTTRAAVVTLFIGETHAGIGLRDLSAYSEFRNPGGSGLTVMPYSTFPKPLAKRKDHEEIVS